MKLKAESVQYRCADCGALTGHSPLCGIAPVEYKAKGMERYYKAWLSQGQYYRELCELLRQRVTLWQGKHAMLRHENNKLRKKLYAKDR